MKKLIGVLVALVSLDFSAFAADGNQAVRNARGYMRVVENGNTGTSEEIQNWNWWSGLVIGLTQVYASDDYAYAICYPDESTYEQLSEIAANYVIAHPEKRTQTASDLVWLAHIEAFGSRKSSQCVKG